MDGFWVGYGDGAIEAAFPPFIGSHYLCPVVGKVVMAPCGALGVDNVAELGLPG